MTFIYGAGLLCLLAIAFVLAPWLRSGSAQVLNQTQDNVSAAVAIVRARLLELEAEWRSGTLDESTYQSLKLEQERRLLADVQGLDGSAPSAGRNGFLLLLATVLVLPVAATLMYRQFGGGLDLSIQQAMQQSSALAQSGQDNRAALETLANLLQQRLNLRDDDDGQRRFTLARLNTELGRHEQAVQQFRQLVKKFPEDADLAGQLAQALYLASNRQLTAEVQAGAERALALNPDQTTALGLLGIAAFERKDYPQALMNWRRLLRQLPPGSGNAQMILRGVQQAEAALGSTGFPGPKVAVTVTLAPELAADLTRLAHGTLFVFAKAVGGPPLPLAVARFDNPTLPISVTLDDSMAMAAGMNLSSFKNVQVFARITASGQVRGAPGDLEGSSAPLELTEKALPVAVSINRRL